MLLITQRFVQKFAQNTGFDSCLHFIQHSKKDFNHEKYTQTIATYFHYNRKVFKQNNGVSSFTTFTYHDFFCSHYVYKKYHISKFSRHAYFSYNSIVYSLKYDTKSFKTFRIFQRKFVSKKSNLLEIDDIHTCIKDRQLQ